MKPPSQFQKKKTVNCIRNCKNRTDQCLKGTFEESLVSHGIQWKKTKKKRGCVIAATFQVRIETNLNDKNDPANP